MFKDGDNLVQSGQICGKNELFDQILVCVKYFADVVRFQKRARIIIDYDPDAENFTITFYQDKNDPMPGNGVPEVCNAGIEAERT